MRGGGKDDPSQLWGDPASLESITDCYESFGKRKLPRLGISPEIHLREYSPARNQSERYEHRTDSQITQLGLSLLYLVTTPP